VTTEGTYWVPLYVGRRRGKCATRAHKTHNKKAIRHTRRHGFVLAAVARGTLARIGGVRLIGIDDVEVEP